MGIHGIGTGLGGDVGGFFLKGRIEGMLGAILCADVSIVVLVGF
jgi:hypothetical protein